LTEYFCPGCATTLEVEVLQKGDAPLHDELQLSGRAYIVPFTSQETC
jgi:hypothetical protein